MNPLDAATFADSRMTTVGVVIPAHNEAQRICAAVGAVMRACDQVDASCMVVVVDDNSTDGTGQLAKAALGQFSGFAAVVTGRFGGASSARRAGVDRFRSVVSDPANTWLLSTDADSVVPDTWIESYLDHHQRGAAAVAGIVDLTDDEAGRLIAKRWRGDYGSSIAEDLSHPHVHAANLGLRLDVYDAAGGFGERDRIEDVGLWRRVRGAGHATVADSSIVVSTSARMTGRVEFGFGFASALRRLYGESDLAPG